MGSKSRRPSRRLTFEDAVKVWVISLTTREFQNRIAAEFDTNPGRINEVLKGSRHPGAYSEAVKRLGIGANDNTAFELKLVPKQGDLF